MRRPHSLRALAAATLLLASASAMAAQGTLTTGFTDVKVGVIDLTPDDGSAAGFSVTSISTRFIRK